MSTTRLQEHCSGTAGCCCTGASAQLMSCWTSAKLLWKGSHCHKQQLLTAVPLCCCSWQARAAADASFKQRCALLPLCKLLRAWLRSKVQNATAGQNRDVPRSIHRQAKASDGRPSLSLSSNGRCQTADKHPKKDQHQDDATAGHGTLQSHAVMSAGCLDL